MKLIDHFKNVFTYAYGVEAWAKKCLDTFPWNYTFVADFAIADFMSGTKGVNETYRRVMKSWERNYKALTEIVVSLNMLSWAHDALRKQGIDNREPFIELYSELYYKAKDRFYKLYGKDTEKCNYFFELTD